MSRLVPARDAAPRKPSVSDDTPREPSKENVDRCRRCELWEHATQGVPGEGPRGKRRIHKTPMQRHLDACHVWLEGELARERPGVIVTLGATALAAVYGRRIPITQARARALENPDGTPIVATYHPSAILRVPDHDARVKLRATLVADLTRAAKMGGKPAR